MNFNLCAKLAGKVKMQGSSGTVSSTGRRRRNRDTRGTPYSVRERRKNVEPSAVDYFLPNFSPTSDQAEFTKDVLLKTWQLHHVSPLWCLSTSEPALSTYGQQLSDKLSEALHYGLGMRLQLHQGAVSVGVVCGQIVKTTTGSAKLNVSLSLVKRIGLDGSDGLKVTAIKKTANRETVVLEAFLCRMGTVEGVREGFTSLPLLLSRGPRNLSSELQQWLQSSFDCHIAPHPLDPDDLCLLVGEYATAEKSGRGLGGVELVYSAPPPVASQGLSTVSVSLPYESVVSVWERAGTSGAERRQGFVKQLVHHVEGHFGFKLQNMSLLRVSTPVLHAESTGKVKFTTVDPIIQVLSFIQSRHF